MSNLGFVQALEGAGLSVLRTWRSATGTSWRGCARADNSLGGEQSGHVIMSEHATTGDGLLTALHVMRRMVVTGSTLAELAGVMTRLPQVLINVPGVDKSRTDDPELLAAVAAEEAAACWTGPDPACPRAPSRCPGDGRAPTAEAADLYGRSGRRGAHPPGLMLRRKQVLSPTREQGESATAPAGVDLRAGST